MFPDNRGTTGWRLRRLRLPMLVLLLVRGAGATWWWKAAHTAPETFVYVHGKLAAPMAEVSESVFELVGLSGKSDFTLAQLKALPAVQYRAYQPQLKRSFMYTGVPLRDLAALTGLSGRDLRVTADDQFGATIPSRMHQDAPVLLAYLEDGQPISVGRQGAADGRPAQPGRAYVRGRGGQVGLVRDVHGGRAVSAVRRPVSQCRS